MLLPIANVQPIPNVVSATDEQFQAFVVAAGIPVDDGGIAEWSFDDRLDVICHALTFGLLTLSQDAKQLVLPRENNSDSELFEGDQPAQEAQA